MIKNLRFSNFYSFTDDTLIDFSLGKKPTPSGFDIAVGSERYNKVIAIVGANGSGKTQFLKPLAFLSWFVLESFLKTNPDEKIPCEPHRLEPNKPSEFALEFQRKGKDYRYELCIADKIVLFEGLFEKTSTQYSYLFKREKTADGYRYKQKGFSFPKAQAERIRNNASVLGAAHNYDVPEAKIFIDFFGKVAANVGCIGRHHYRHEQLLSTAKELYKQPKMLAQVSKAMGQIDLGLAKVKVRKIQRRDPTGKAQSEFLPFGVHVTDTGETFQLPFLEESSGTQSAFVLLTPILRTLQNGGLAVIDELDNDLHPHLVPHLLQWFEYEHTNPHHAQLIFTCHTPEVLNLLQKHQVYLVEKRNQRSDAWRLDDMTGLRADDNLYAKYMAGALGATPEL